jgi:hypothetical protein
MPGSAKLQSIDAVAAVSTALRCFEEEAVATLGDLDLEIGRILRWIDHDRKDYWKDQLRRGYEKLSEARINLERRRVLATSDLGPSCHEEQKALEAAKRRVRLAEEKIETVRRWSHVIDRELIEFRAALNQLAGWLEADLPQAQALLKRMIQALTRYVALQASPQAVPPPRWSDVSGDEQPPQGDEAVATGPAPENSPPAAPVEGEEPVPEES